LYKAINRLQDAEKAIIILYLEDYDYKEIAEIMGISESNTGVKINRIKSQLIKLLENESE
jgi:RNA polymerase sigma-70 factor (ECF subfamily)